MRAKFGPIVEKGRVRGGKWGSEPGFPCGAFQLRHPRTMRALHVIAGSGMGWDHVSVSANRKCPSWVEMDWVKRLFFEDDELVVQYHVPRGDHINNHPFCLHMWRPHDAEIPTPPKWMV